MTATPQRPNDRPQDSDHDNSEMAALMAEIDEIERGLLADPADFDMLLRAARWGERTGRYDESRSFYMHAAAAAPTRPEPLVALSDLLRGQSLHNEAVELLQNALERMPERAELWCAIARVMTDLGTNDKAELFLAEALRLEPNNVTARLQRGALRRRSERNGGPSAW
jgi:cytochrome c-type biogenesis protein CcmH/NrfG